MNPFVISSLKKKEDVFCLTKIPKKKKHINRISFSLASLPTDKKAPTTETKIALYFFVLLISK